MTEITTEPGLYNLESVYDEKISPLMQQIIDICKAHSMPMIASFAYENCEEKGVGCCTTHLIFEGRNIREFSKAASAIRSKSVWLGAFTIASGVKGE